MDCRIRWGRNGICIATIGSWDDIRGGAVSDIFSIFRRGLDFSVFYAARANYKTKKSTPEKKSVKKHLDFRGREKL